MKIISTFIAAVLLSVGFALPAEAKIDHRSCVTKGEFRRIENGDTMRRVTRVFDTKGYAVSRQRPWISRNYKPCTPWGVVNIVFKHKKVKGKYAIWQE